MNRDNVLFLVIGALTGFLAGYLMQESMAMRQPAPVRPPTAAAQGNPSAGPGPAPAGGTGPAMAEVQELSARVAQNPNDAAAIRRLANLNYDISNWQRAAELYERYLEIEAGDPDVMTDLGATYRNLGRPNDALAQFRGARQRDPEHWQALYNEILVHAFDLEDLEAANSAMAQLQRLQPDNPNVSRLAEELAKRSQGA